MQTRNCPLCGDAAADTLLEPEADEFCRTNWSYRPDFRALLDLPPRATFPIVRCRRCAFAYARRLPDDAFLTTLYESVIREEDCVLGSENRPSHARRLRYVAELIELAPPGDLRALDYGSGLGVTTRMLRACGVNTIAFDPSSLRSSYSREPAGTRQVQEGAPYSVMVLDNVLEHLPDPVDVMRRLRTMMAPAAVAYVSVPPYEREMMDRQIEAHRRGTALDMTLNPWEHLNYFTLAHLDALMAGAGLARIAAANRLAPPPVGLRAERSISARAKNAAASVARLGRYVATGDVLATTEHAFYRLEY